MKCLTQTLAALAGVLSASIALVAASAAAAQAVRAGGTGAALGVVEAVAAAYAASPGGQAIRVLPSLGSSGGLRALDAKAIDLALIARRLTPAETQAGLREAACLRTPYALVTSHHAPPPSLSQDDILRLYRDAAPA